MNPEPSLRVNRLVRHIKEVGFHLETDELLERGVVDVLVKDYGVDSPLTQEELNMIEDELLNLAEWNEISEGRYQARKAQPEDRGTMIFRQNSEGGMGKVSSYSLPYSYPVDQNLRELSLKKPGWASTRLREKKKPRTKASLMLLQVSDLLYEEYRERKPEQAKGAGVSE